MGKNQQTRHGRPASAGHEAKQTQPYYDKSWAVVVGIDDYGDRHEPLRNARNDAKEIARVLRQVYRFEEVHTLYNKKATKGAIETWLEDKLPKHTGENDRVRDQIPFFSYLPGSDQGDFVFELPRQEPKRQTVTDRSEHRLVINQTIDELVSQHPITLSVAQREDIISKVLTDSNDNDLTEED